MTGTRRALVVLEVSLSMTLLVGAGLVINSFNRLIRVDPGFDTDNLLFMTLSLPEHTYQTNAVREDFSVRLQARLAAVPGVREVTIAQGLPPGTGFSFGVEISAEGDTDPRSEQPMLLPSAHVDGDFFDLMGIPLVAGRTFNATDDGKTRTVVIDTDLARFLLGCAH